jgi:hypothetical protein
MKPRRPRVFVCATAIELFIHGSRGVGLHLTKGAQVDFDQVIGDDDQGPMTLERALGPHTQCFQPAQPAVAPVAQNKD